MVPEPKPADHDDVRQEQEPSADLHSLRRHGGRALHPFVLASARTGPVFATGNIVLISGRFSSVNDPRPVRRERFTLTSAPEMVSAPSRSRRRDAGEKRRTAARHDSQAAAQECDRTELAHDETGVAEYVTCSDDPADRHRTPRAARFAPGPGERSRVATIHSECWVSDNPSASIGVRHRFSLTEKDS